MIGKASVIASLVSMLAVIGLVQHSTADFGITTVWMKVENSNVNTMKKIQWSSERYDFEKVIPIDVDDIKQKKIERIFGTKEFTFTWQMSKYEAEWLHFDVTLEMNATPGTTLTVAFV